MVRTDDSIVETDGLIVVEIVNNTDIPIFNPADMACDYIHVQIIGITEEERGGGRCHGYGGSQALLPGTALRTRFDFRNAGGHDYENCLKRELSTLRMVKLLIKHGADPTIKDKKGMTALDHARLQELEKVIEKLEAVSAR